MSEVVGQHRCLRCGEYEHSYLETDCAEMTTFIGCNTCGYVKFTDRNGNDKTKEHIEEEKKHLEELMEKASSKLEPFPDLKLEPLFNSEQINEAVKRIASSIPKNNDTILMCVLDGAIPFFADLLKYLENAPIYVCSAKSSSYSQAYYTGHVDVQLNFDPHILKDKNVYIIDDIYDHGSTLRAITNSIKNYPKSIKWICLVKKIFNPKQKFPEYLNTDSLIMGDDFVVGYGLDYDGYYRNYSSIYKVIKDANT